MIRVGIDYTSAVRQRAGIGRYTRGLVGALAELDRTNDYVLFSAGRDQQARAWPSNYKLREIPLSDRHLAILWQRLRLPIPVELVTGRLDVFHSPDFVLAPVYRARTVLTVHDLSFVRHPECSLPPLLDYLMHAVPRSVSRADVILADSVCTRRDLIELLHVPQDRVFVMYPGVEPPFVPQSDEGRTQAVLRRYGIRAPYILGLGTLQPRKNFPRLIRAYCDLKRTHHLPHQLVIGGGEGWLYQEIDQAIDDLGLREDVLLPGFVADEDLPVLYGAADVFAFPSLYEGFGLPVLEAMACGTPVVASSTSSLPEVAGDAALLVPPEDTHALADSLWRLLDDSALRNQLRARGFERVKLFVWRNAAQSLLSTYERITSNGG